MWDDINAMSQSPRHCFEVDTYGWGHDRAHPLLDVKEGGAQNIGCFAEG